MTHIRQRFPNTEELEALPVITEGQADDLHIDTGDFRAWLSRTGVMDGEPYENTVTIETLTFGRWETLGVYDGDDPPHGIPGATPGAFAGEY
jgi:hypothetical protein